LRKINCNSQPKKKYNDGVYIPPGAKVNFTNEEMEPIETQYERSRSTVARGIVKKLYTLPVPADWMK